MDLSAAIAVAAEQINRVVQGVDPACFGDASPCTDWDVKTLAGHIAGFASMSAAAASRQAFEPYEFDPATWKEVYAEASAALAGAWNAPGALEGSVSFGGTEMPAMRAAAITLQELVLHGWDLAAATRQAYEPSPAVAAAVRTVVERGAEQARGFGAYGDPVDVPDDADDFTLALAKSGRDPSWSS